METKIAVAYARFSSEKQNHTSIEVQISKIEEFCKKYNILLIEKYIDEAQTGTNDRRKSFQKMIEDSEKGLFQYVIVHRNDRWARNTEDAMYYSKLLGQRGIRIISVIENFDTKTPEGSFFNLVSMGMAELYTKKQARESWEGLLASVKQCKVMGGNPPYGYKIIGSGKNKKYAIVPKEAKVIKRIFEEIANGSSYKETYDMLQNEGYCLKNFTMSAMHDRLRNEKYKGEYVYNKQEHRTIDNKKMRHRFKDESEIIRIPNGFPKIVSEELFDKVQKIMNGRRQKRIVKKESRYLLTNLIKCGECGKVVCGSTTYSHQTSVHSFYECCSTAVPQCSCKRITMRYLDNYVMALMRSVFLKIENAKWLKQLITNSLNASIEALTVSQNDNNIKIAELESLIDDRNKAKFSDLQSTATLEFIGEEIAEYTRMIIKLKHNNLDLANEIKKKDVNVYVEQIRKSIRKFKPLLQTVQLSTQREFLRKSIHQILLYKDKVVVQTNLWWLIDADYNNELANDLIVEIEETREFLNAYNFDENRVNIHRLKIKNVPKPEVQ